MFFCRFGLGVVISIHASAREATRNVICPIYFFRFQSTPPRGRRHIDDFHSWCSFLISIHASAREATGRPAVIISNDIDFNPRLREGGDVQCGNRKDKPGISIHASAREATKRGLKNDPVIQISIHASAREATLTASRYCSR